jgi:hypothetical protein
VPLLGSLIDGTLSAARDLVTFCTRQKQWLFCMLAFVLVWTLELYFVQATTLVYPNDTGPRFAFWAPKIRLALDFLFVGMLAVWLRPRWLTPVLCGSFFVYLGLMTYHRYFLRPLSLMTIVSTWREGLSLSDAAWNLFPLGAAIILGAAFMAKLLALALAGRASPPRGAVRLTTAALAVGYVGLYLTANHFDPLSAIQTTRGVGRLGAIRGYLGPWAAEWYYLRNHGMLSAALERRRISYDRLTSYEAPIPIHSRLVIIQAESFDYNILGYRVDDQEVTPFLNQLRAKAMFYRVRAMHSNGSADADFATLNGVAGSTHANTYTIRDYPYTNTTPELLDRCGYATYSFHGNSGDFYNRRQPFEKMGFTACYFREELESEFGLKSDRWGIPDRDVLALAAQKLRTATEPTCEFIITLTTHVPYRQLAANEMEIFPRPRTTVQNYINNMRYLDNCLRDFIVSLGSGVTVMIYADHPTEDGEGDFSPDRSGAREYIPCFIYDSDQNLADLQKTRKESLAYDGSLNLVDVVNYLRHQIEKSSEQRQTPLGNDPRAGQARPVAANDQSKGG